MASEGSSGGFVAGVVVSIVCSVCNSVGMGLQKLTHRRLESRPAADRAYWREPQWLFGLLAMTLASVCALGNYALLGQSRAAAMASLTIVTNAVMARYLLGEPFALRDAAVAALIMAGIVVAVVFGSSAGGASSIPLQALLDTIDRPAAAGMAAGVVCVAAAFVAFITYAVRRGAARTHIEARLECACRAFLAGLCSGLTGFLAKGVVVTVEAMFRAKSVDDLRMYQFWLFLIFLPVSIVLQLRELNGGLRRFDATEVVPAYQAAIVIWGVTFGWGFYQENEALETFDEVMFALGVSVSILGIAAIGFFKRAAPDAAAAAAAAALGDGAAVDATKLLDAPAGGDVADGAPFFAPAKDDAGGGTGGASGGAGALPAGAAARLPRRMTGARDSDFAMPGAGFIEAVNAFAPSGLAHLVAPIDEEERGATSPEKRGLLASETSLPNIRMLQK
jgi:drug/metabolite transporter (DMT)-like permease